MLHTYACIKLYLCFVHLRMYIIVSIYFTPSYEYFCIYILYTYLCILLYLYIVHLRMYIVVSVYCTPTYVYCSICILYTYVCILLYLYMIDSAHKVVKSEVFKPLSYLETQQPELFLKWKNINHFRIRY